jgi:hypothetical protein
VLHSHSSRTEDTLSFRIINNHIRVGVEGDLGDVPVKSTLSIKARTGSLGR